MAPLEYIQRLLDTLSQSNDLSRALVTVTSAGGFLVFVFLVLKLLYTSIQGLRLYVFSQYCRGRIHRYGKWAVVTGATDGIGRAIATELAGRGMSIVAVGRNEEKLENTKQALLQVPNVGEVETLRVDLSEWSVEKLREVGAQLDPDNRDIGVLVNNAGTASAKFLDFNSFEPESMMAILNVNCLATVLLTRLIMPGMLKRSRGLIMNVSSMVGSSIWPYLNIYAPSKTFVNAFTRQLRMEYDSSNVDFALLHTGPVYTKLADPLGKDRPRILVPTADSYARSAINAQSAGLSEYSGHWASGLVIILTNVVVKLGLAGQMANVIRNDQRRQG